MEKNVTLGLNFATFEDKNGCWTLVDEPVTYHIKGLRYKNVKTYAVLENGDVKRKVYFTNDLEIPADIIKGGAISGKIVITKNDEPIKEFTLEPLIIKELNDKVESIAQIDSCIARVDRVEKALLEIKKILLKRGDIYKGGDDK